MLIYCFFRLIGPTQLENVPDNSGEDKPYFCMSGYAQDIIEKW